MSDFCSMVNVLDESILCETSDKIKMRVKAILVTKNNTNSMTHGVLRQNLVGTLQREISKMSYDDFISSVTTRKFQSALKHSLKRIYPLKICEIRHFKREFSENGIVQEPQKVEAVPATN